MPPVGSATARQKADGLSYFMFLFKGLYVQHEAREDYKLDI